MIVRYVFKFKCGTSLTLPPERMTCITDDFIKGLGGPLHVFKMEYHPVVSPSLVPAYRLNEDNGVMVYLTPEKQLTCKEQMYHLNLPELVEKWWELFI